MMLTAQKRRDMPLHVIRAIDRVREREGVIVRFDLVLERLTDKRAATICFVGFVRLLHGDVLNLAQPLRESQHGLRLARAVQTLRNDEVR